MGRGDIVIYESTVCPGITEDECVPILERTSGLVFNRDFFAGYSPERINPGDKEHTVEKIMKVTSGSTPEAAEKVDALYRSVIQAGTFPVSSIKVAEAAKVIENSQRDINIAFMNELSKIFHLIDGRIYCRSRREVHDQKRCSGAECGSTGFRLYLQGKLSRCA